MSRRFVTPRARMRPDRGGDPLDGLVNLFDLGIVLSVAFLLAALSSVKLAPRILGSKRPVTPAIVRQVVTVGRGQSAHALKLSGKRVVGAGARIGSVYRLADGRVVYVEGK